MENTSTEHATILEFRRDIEAQFRHHIREALEVSLQEELTAAPGSGRGNGSRGGAGPLA